MSLDKYVSRGFTASSGGGMDQWVAKAPQAPSYQPPPQQQSGQGGTSFVMGGTGAGSDFMRKGGGGGGYGSAPPVEEGTGDFPLAWVLRLIPERVKVFLGWTLLIALLILCIFGMPGSDSERVQELKSNGRGGSRTIQRSVPVWSR